MSRSNETLALTLLVDATANTARKMGQEARARRDEQARQDVQRIADNRRREIRNAFGAAGARIVVLAPVWLFLCFIIFANNSMENYFADGSYSVTTWTFIFVIGGALAIDLFVARGNDRWFVAGAALGFALNAWYTFSRPLIAAHPLDVSMFWLTGLFGLIAYLVSALRAKQSSR